MIAPISGKKLLIIVNVLKLPHMGLRYTLRLHAGTYLLFHRGGGGGGGGGGQCH